MGAYVLQNDNIGARYQIDLDETWSGKRVDYLGLVEIAIYNKSVPASYLMNSVLCGSVTST